MIDPEYPGKRDQQWDQLWLEMKEFKIVSFPVFSPKVKGATQGESGRKSPKTWPVSERGKKSRRPLALILT